jgi:hypothetical protein
VKKNQKSKPTAVPEAQPSMLIATPPEEDPLKHPIIIEQLKQAWGDCQSASDEFDKNILTYSSAGLGISLVFLKDIVPLANAVGLYLLYASWVAFGFAILVTVSSFRLSEMALNDHVKNLNKYGVTRRTEDLNPPNKKASWVGYLKWVSGSCFVLAIVGTIVFSIWNLTEAKHMNESKIDRKAMGMDGRPPLSMTPLPPLEKGRQPIVMTPLPSNAQPQLPTQPSSQVRVPQTPVNPNAKK